MEHFKEEFKDLEIQLEEIISATNNFKTKIIGSGGFGKVYEGELPRFKEHGKVAIKRLDPRLGQGDTEFWKEITILNHHKHENLIRLLGFCIEGHEMILVYEYASNGSLDRHLISANFTWTQRLKTCLAAARGLSFLHDAKGTKERVIHRDIKSANILLDANWNAKVSDMGLSRIAPANQPQTGVYTRPAGTPGYLDPLYLSTNLLTKESDVYSFGVVLFEVLCGRFCLEKGQTIVPTWKKSYEDNKLQEIIFNNLKQYMDQNALKEYSNIAFRCLGMSREERPRMPYVVEVLKTALKYQEIYDEVITRLKAGDPLNYESESETQRLLLKGILINSGKTWFSLDTNGDHCEMISIADCLTSTASESQHYIRSPEYISRFAVGCYEPCGAHFETHVRTKFLSPQIMYTVNLVFKRKIGKEQYTGLEYRLEVDKERSAFFTSNEREDGWLTGEMYQFTSQKRDVNLKIWFYLNCCPDLLVESIEFRPLKKVTHEVLKDVNVPMQVQPGLDTETHWEQKLPIDYVEIVRWSVNGVRWRSKEELYYNLCEGFPINSGAEWFFIARDGKKCLMLSAKAVLNENQWKFKSEPAIRFGQVADCNSEEFDIRWKFSSRMLSPETTYAAYLVYSGLPDEYKDTNPPLQVVDEYWNSEVRYNIFLRTPRTPVIRWNKNEERTFNPSSRPKVKLGLPKLRSGKWMEVQVHEFKTRAIIEETISTHLRFYSYDIKSLKGITVHGLEFRPI